MTLWVGCPVVGVDLELSHIRNRCLINSSGERCIARLFQYSVDIRCRGRYAVHLSFDELHIGFRFG